MKLPEIASATAQVAVAGFLVGAAAIALVAFAFIGIGGVDVSANAPHGWLMEHLLHFTFKRSVSFHSDTVLPPPDLDAPSRVKLGAQHYDMVCSNCHGVPGSGQSGVALSMQPRPQSLRAVVGQFTDAELFWIVKHGVKFSAMPSWPNQTRNDEVWSMVAFLKKLPKMSTSDYRDLTTTLPDAPLVDAKLKIEATPDLRAADTQRNTEPIDEYLYAVPATGFSDPRLKVDPVAVCSRCHGKDGTGSATYGEAPNITLQDATYLKATLDAYATGTRKSGFMQQVAGQLSADQINNLAQYFAKMPKQTFTGAVADARLVDHGKLIATEGLKADAVPACATCHESVGSKTIPAPHIAGQSEKFLRHELEAMRDGGRGSTGLWNPMSAVAHDFSDDNIAAVAAYYASLPLAQTAVAATPAEGNKEDGKKIFATNCVTCHLDGARGDAYGGFPNLSIQTTPYIAQALRSYRAGTKENAQMSTIAHGLDDDDVAALASYLGDLSPNPSPVRGDPEAALRGEAIAKNGFTERSIPSCLSCHSAESIANLPLIARLQGQNDIYLKSRLDYFASYYGASDETSLNPMPAIARLLSDAERADVAAYFASAAPLKK